MNILLFVYLISISSSERTRFVIPHTHLDLGWLRTVDEYYFDSVIDIFDTTLQALSENPDTCSTGELKRKFVFSEIGYLKRYLEHIPELKESKIAKIKQLIENGQWEFVNGGISQPDTACPTHDELLDNFNYALRYLRDKFDVGVNAGWQLDPFGHSLTHAYLAAKFGMKHIVMTRISDPIRDKRTEEQSLQFRWVFPDKSSIIGHIMQNYSAIEGIDCDLDCKSTPFDREKFQKGLSNWEKGLKYDTFILLGEDFNWTKASSRFKFMDDVLKIESSLKYSLFSEYTAAFDKQHEDLPTYSSDFFPLDQSIYVLSGYYTTNPRLKVAIRNVGKTIRTFRSILFSLVPSEKWKTLLKPLVEVSEDFGILTHHDAITGTSRDKTNEDYFYRINIMHKTIEGLFAKIFNENFVFCDQTDIKAGLNNCPVSFDNSPIFLRVYNAQPVALDKMLEFSLQGRGEVNISIIYKIDKTEELVRWESYCYHNNVCSVFIREEIQAHEMLIYRVEFEINSQKKQKKKIDSSEIVQMGNFKVQYINNSMRVIDENTGMVNIWSLQYIETQDGTAYYNSYPQSTEFKPYSAEIFVNMSDGRLLSIIEYYSDLFSIRSVVFYETNSYKVDIQIKATPELSKGIEVVVQLDVREIEKQIVSTDSNNLFLIPRQSGDKIESSIYPISSQALITNEDSTIGVNVYTDRAQGVLVQKDEGTRFYIQRTQKEDFAPGVLRQRMKEKLNILARYEVYNFRGEMDKGIDAAIRNGLDNSDFRGFSTSLNSLRCIRRDQSTQLNSVKLVFDIIDEDSFLIRALNMKREASESIDFKNYFNELFPHMKSFEVDFDFFAQSSSSRKRKPIQEIYNLESLEFRTFLITDK